ncbi:MAG: hypothetical protein XD86_1356 [Mesotoga infera]|uniref:Uncharacterized protein n=1 Tax=Mesotoga infera TaxID=1236046 RepID=A0A117LT55_9BACT|nr:MAG: hypothetical protein XD86_1356 [Mesotoga infera]
MTIHEDDVKDPHPVVLLYGISHLERTALRLSQGPADRCEDNVVRQRFPVLRISPQIRRQHDYAKIGTDQFLWSVPFFRANDRDPDQEHCQMT